MYSARRSLLLGVSVAIDVALVLAVCMLPRTAWAYIDFASGSIILQGVLAAVFAALITLKLYWKRLKARFSRTGRTSGAPPGAPPADGA